MKLRIDLIHKKIFFIYVIYHLALNLHNMYLDYVSNGCFVVHLRQ